MELTPGNAISPIDGRYRKYTEPLAYYFSEAAYFNYRVFVEIEYFIALCEIPLKQLEKVDRSDLDELRAVSRDFTFEDAEEVKEIEKVTNHDVKAVEYFVKKRMEKIHGLKPYKEFVHFGLTSQDLNNTAMPYATKLAYQELLLPMLEELVKLLQKKVKEWKDITMLARTHGQPASPTKLGKEIQVYVERVQQQLTLMKSIPFSAKFGGATGNFNAHCVAYPEIDWAAFGDRFLSEKLGLARQKTTTQIEHYDNLAAFFDGLSRISTILLDLCRDMWTYISMEYFFQKIKAEEVGSSAMPHKVNPIDFENAEGNLGITIAIFRHLSEKLPVSRLQRDLTDSTVIRNIGVPVGHLVISLKSITKGMNKLLLNQQKMNEDLENNWAVVAEAIQTILRRENYPKPYEALKELTRTNKKIDKTVLWEFIDKLKVSPEVRQELKAITPMNYTGIKLT
jgi:adenylosuccinate lyase